MLRVAIKRKWNGEALDGSNSNDANNNGTATTIPSRVRFDIDSADIPDFYSGHKLSSIRSSNLRMRSHSQPYYDSGFESFVPSQCNSTRGSTKHRLVRHSTVDDCSVPVEPLVAFEHSRPAVPQPGSD